MKTIHSLGFICLCALLCAQTDTLTIFDFEDPNAQLPVAVFGNYYLNGQQMSSVQNPILSSSNNSNHVLQYKKAINANREAGFSIDISNRAIPVSSYEICFDYMADHQGSCALELIGHGKNDFQHLAMPYTKPGYWQRLCQKIYPALETPERRSANAYADYLEALRFYPDYGQWGDGQEYDYYVDNISFCYDTGERLVNFSVDMNNYFQNFSKVFVSGTFNAWSGNTHPLQDEDGDGVWETSILTKDGPMEYLFTIDGWTDYEYFEEDFDCIASSPDGSGGYYRNRFVDVESSVDLPVSCFQSCSDCLPTNYVTWNLNMTEEVVSDEGVYLAGGAFGHGDYELLDEDGDGIYSITLERINGFSTHYTFINGLCPVGWWCKEDLAGQACADEDSYNDRFLNPLYGNRTINTCFGYCSSNGYCEEELFYTVTFNFDTRDPYYDGFVAVAGTFNEWSFGNHYMEDYDGDGIYTIEIEMPAGPHEYKFIRGKEWEVFEEEQECTITDETGLYTNRFLDVPHQDVYMPPVEFGLCEGYSSTVEVSVDKLSIYPTLAVDQIFIDLAGHSDEVTLTIVDASGSQVSEMSIKGGGEEMIDVQGLTSGVYFVVASDGQKMYTSRFVKS